MAAELAAAEAEAAIRALTGGGPAARRGRPAAPAPRAGRTLALSPYNAAAAGRALAREPDWQPLAATLARRAPGGGGALSDHDGKTKRVASRGNRRQLSTRAGRSRHTPLAS